MRCALCRKKIWKDHPRETIEIPTRSGKVEGTIHTDPRHCDRPQLVKGYLDHKRKERERELAKVKEGVIVKPSEKKIVTP